MSFHYKNILLVFGCFLCMQGFSEQRFEIKALRNLEDGNVSQYETIEIGIRLPELEREFQLFLADPSKGINPYKKHFLRLQFNCRNQFYIADAFYMQDCIPDEINNKYAPVETQWPWRVRFAVPDTGKWDCIALFGESVNMATPRFTGVSFNCIPGNRHGYLKISADKKHFEYTDGTPFFAIGQNMCCPDELLLKGYDGQPPVYIPGYYDVYHYLQNFSDAGGNYTRLGLAPWHTGNTGDGILKFSTERTFALDSIIKIAELNDFHIQLAIDLPRFNWKDGGGGYWYIGSSSPFKKQGMTDADLLNDSSALAYYYDYIRYIYNRWAFSPAIGSIEIFGEHDLWEGYTGREKYFYRFITVIDSILKTEYGNRHLISTSVANEKHYEIFHNPAISFIDRHHYDNDLRCNQKRYNIIHKRSIEAMNKPFLFGEMGMINGPVNESDADDFEHCNDISYHNAMWSTFFMGGAGTCLYWWQWKNDAYRENNFPALRFFLDSVIDERQFSKNELWMGNGLETFYEIDSGKTYVAGWVHNTSYWWGNMMQNCRDRNGKEKFLPKDNDKAGTPQSRAGEKFVVGDLFTGKVYKISFYDTRKKGAPFQTMLVKSNWLGKLRIPMPDRPDCAFTISAPVQ